MKLPNGSFYILFLLGSGCWALSGCAGSDPRRLSPAEALSHTDPAVRIPAFQQAAEQQNKAAVPYLVEGLTDSNRAVRFYAIQALQRLTGETYGYDYKAGEAAREAAAARWRAALQQVKEQP